MVKEKEPEVEMTAEERAFTEEWRSRIGQDWPPVSAEEVFDRSEVVIYFGWGAEADWSAIKKWAILNRDFNALWFDEEYARKSRWGGIIAPPSYLHGVHNGAEVIVETFMDGVKRKDKMPNIVGQLWGEEDWEFFEPVRPGDKISIKHKLVDVYWRYGRNINRRLMFLVGESTLTNQKGQLVGIVRARCANTFYPLNK